MLRTTAAILTLAILAPLEGLASPMILLSQERETSISVADWSTYEVQTAVLASQISLDAGSFQSEASESYSSSVGGVPEESSVTVSQSSSISGTSIQFSGAADAEAGSGWHNLMAESVLRVSFQIDFTSGYLLDYDLWALGDIDPQISLVGTDNGVEVFRLNAHPNDFATTACPYNDQSDPGHCAGLFAGTLAAGTYALTARVEAASYYPYGGSADFTLSVAPL